MGKVSKWLKGLFGFKKPDPANIPHSKRRWSFAISHRRSQDNAVAAAAVKLTNLAYVTRNGAGYGRREKNAAVMIQSHFRAYLARRALRALKALVMLQALVRGQILRKHYLEKLRMQAIMPRPTSHSSPLYHSGQAMLQERLDYTILARNAMQEQLMMLERKGSRSNTLIRHTRTSERSWEQGSFHRTSSTDDERNDKILEVDTWKPKHKHIFHSPQLSHTYFQSFSMSGEVRPLKLNSEDDENDFTTAENSPHYYYSASSSSIRTPFRTPTKIDSSTDHPSYMAYTQSSKAKVRSLSAPKQRPVYERSSSTNRYSVHGYGKGSTLHANFTNKVYPGSGRLDRLGMPVKGDVFGFGGGH